MEKKKNAAYFSKYLLLFALQGTGFWAVAQTNIVKIPEDSTTLPFTAPDDNGVITGAERMNAWLPLIKDKQVGLVVNHSSLVGQRHLVDTLCRLGQCVARIFAPEHGFRGTAPDGEYVQEGQDIITGTPVVSLYGKTRKPSREDFDNVDVVVFDIQDVGARFYTYISTLFYVLEACAEYNKPVIILDRPNPNGHYVDGPVLDMRLSSFVGIAPLPIVHGCTMGELARLFTNENWIRQPHPLRLGVIPCQNYTHHTPYNLPVKPSPNLPNMRAVLLYPSLCLFEGTTVSVGRGTSSQFQVIGHPDFPRDSFWFVPHRNSASLYPPQEGWVCKGYDFTGIPLSELRSRDKIDLQYLLNYYALFPNKDAFFRTDGYFDRLAGTYSLRKQIEAGATEAEIRATWQADLDAYKEIRRKYLLYPE